MEVVFSLVWEVISGCARRLQPAGADNMFSPLREERQNRFGGFPMLPS